MVTNQNPGTIKDPPQVTPEELQKQISNGLTTADDSAAQGMRTLKLVHQSRVAHLTRTAAFLTKKYGADDPRAKDAQAAVSAEKVTVARVSVAHQQVSTPAPEVSTTGWALHGRVFDAQLKPVTGHTVFLVDSSKTYQQTYGFAYTDDTGYFQLNYAGSDAASRDKSAAATQAPAADLFIGIVNEKALPVHVSTTPFQPVESAATYQNITVPGGDKPIGNPPPEIRGIAFPFQEKRKKAKRKKA
jgi:hypothetical protein